MTRLALCLIGALLPMAPTLAQAPAEAPRPSPGTMTLAQFQARMGERMMAADTDGDGRISAAEWAARLSGRPGGAGAGTAGRGGDPARLFAIMDTNHDGVVDRGEGATALATRFARMDANGDGIVSPDERMAMRGGRRGRGMGGATEPGAGASPAAGGAVSPPQE